MSSAVCHKRPRNESQEELSSAPKRECLDKETKFSLLFNNVFIPAGLHLTQIPSPEKEYEKRFDACFFGLSGKTVAYRTAINQGEWFYVPFWKRPGVQPFEVGDGIDFLVTAVENQGLFIFDQQTLANRGVLSRDDIKGKTGMRLHLPQPRYVGKRAQAAQKWQKGHFVALKDNGTADSKRVRSLFKIPPS